jgi:hypothetical protein
VEAEGSLAVQELLRAGWQAALTKGRRKSSDVEAPGDLGDGGLAVCEFPGPGGELEIIAELGQAGHRAGDLRGCGARPPG